MKRSAILLLYQSGKSQAQIFKTLESCKVTKNLVSRTIRRYLETGGGIEDRPRSGRPRSKRTPAMMNALRARIRRNPRQSQQKLALQFDMSPKTARKALKEVLGLKPRKRAKGTKSVKCSGLIYVYRPKLYALSNRILNWSATTTRAKLS
jgi:transposase